MGDKSPKNTSKTKKQKDQKKAAAGNYAKVKVVSYGYDLELQWVTYKPIVE